MPGNRQARLVALNSTEGSQDSIVGKRITHLDNKLMQESNNSILMQESNNSMRMHESNILMLLQFCQFDHILSHRIIDLSF
jgi:hypothetical protein